MKFQDDSKYHSVRVYAAVGKAEERGAPRTAGGSEERHVVAHLIRQVSLVSLKGMPACDSWRSAPQNGEPGAPHPTSPDHTEAFLKFSFLLSEC